MRALLPRFGRHLCTLLNRHCNVFGRCRVLSVYTCNVPLWPDLNRIAVSNRGSLSKIVGKLCRSDATALSATNRTLYEAIHGVRDSHVAPEALDQRQKPIVESYPPKDEHHRFRRIPLSIENALKFEDARQMAKIVMFSETAEIEEWQYEIIALSSRQFLRDTLSILLRQYEAKDPVEYLKVAASLFTVLPETTKYEIAVAEAVNLEKLPTYEEAWKRVQPTIFNKLEELKAMRSAIELEKGRRGRIVEFNNITHFFVPLMYYGIAEKARSRGIVDWMTRSMRRIEDFSVPSLTDWNTLFTKNFEFLEASQNAHSVAYNAEVIMKAVGNHEYIKNVGVLGWLRMFLLETVQQQGA